MKEKNYGKLVKILQISAGILMLVMVALCVVFIKKYNINISNIAGISEMITGGTFAIACGIVAFSVIKSFALVFPPAVLFAICAYLMPDYWTAFVVNLISVFLSLFVPFFLGKFTGAGMVETLKKRFKAIKKIDDFAGSNETQMAFAVKLSGILPGDLSSLLFGAMNISLKKFVIGSNLGMLPLVVVYTFLGVALKNVGDAPWIVAIPVVAIIVFNIIASLFTKNLISKTKSRNSEVKNG
ncbi:MAG: TVP38/TMEM64 family protein [Clostridia bacterium]|nr:TVP38/TMEM64 family protein [Clostridia bacterium]